jgi:hypothetical protein
MVIPGHNLPRRRRDARPKGGGASGSLIIELLIAIAVITIAFFPLAASFLGEQKVCRAYYQRAAAMEIVDGEMEVLVAGAWRDYPIGAQPYRPRAESVSALPPGRFELTVQTDRVRLTWVPNGRHQGGRVVREVKVKRP